MPAHTAPLEPTLPPTSQQAFPRAFRIAESNFAPGNAGYIFWYDILAPAFLVVMYVATR